MSVPDPCPGAACPVCNPKPLSAVGHDGGAERKVCPYCGEGGTSDDAFHPWHCAAHYDADHTATTVGPPSVAPAAEDEKPGETFSHSEQHWYTQDDFGRLHRARRK